MKAVRAGLPLPAGLPDAEQRPDGRADVALEAGLGDGEVLAVEQLIVPLRRRKLVGRIDAAVGQRNDVSTAKPSGM